MTPDTTELLRLTDGEILDCAKRAGTPRDGSVVVRLRPDIHAAVYARALGLIDDLPEGGELVFGGFPITRGPVEMDEAWRFIRREDLPRRKALKIHKDKH